MSHQIGTSPSCSDKQGGNQIDKEPIVCVSCHQVGYKSPVYFTVNTLKKLKQNEVIATVSGKQVPTTIDSGADRSMIPEKLVQPDQFTGTVETFHGVAVGVLKGKLANVVFKVAGVEYQREALTLPCDQIFWTAELSFQMSNVTERNHLTDQIVKNENRSEEDSHYMPPRMVDREIQGAVMVS